MTTFNAERRVFDRLKKDISDEAKAEYETAVAVLVERYNTTIYENRFIVGGAVEVFSYALIRSVGIDANLYSDQEPGGDILLPNNRQLSIKASFRGIEDIRLVNQMGTGNRAWRIATLFVVSGIGIVFGTPDMVPEEYVMQKGDAVVLHKNGLRHLIEDKSNVIDIDIARKPPTEMTGFSLKASTAVARQILWESDAQTLLGVFSIFGVNGKSNI